MTVHHDPPPSRPTSRTTAMAGMAPSTSPTTTSTVTAMDTTTGATTMAPLPLPTGQKRKRPRASSGLSNIPHTPQPKHPYLSGNFAPIQQTLPLTPCTYLGSLPAELADGEYVRNGSNPVSNSDLGRDAHWFDGDGMLSGVSFRRTGTREDGSPAIEPEFVNQFVLTDLYLSTLSSPRLKVPILPSIATLVNPLATFIYVTLRILRTVLLVLLSHLPGSRQKIVRISVANTSLVYHDGRAMALCESGPPMRILLPGLETVGWYNGSTAENEPALEKPPQSQLQPQLDNGIIDKQRDKKLGDDGGLIAFMREWTTAHPKVDPHTREMLMFHSSFAPPYVQYSIIPRQAAANTSISTPRLTKVLNAAVPGVHAAKMMHDFGVSRTHTIIMDLPLTLDPMNQFKGLPPVTFDSNKPSRFGVFPRRQPEKVLWFETEACCIFHTANAWDDVDEYDDALDAREDAVGSGNVKAVNLLACRLTSATMIFAAGNIEPPIPTSKKQKSMAAATARARRKRMPFFSAYDVVSESAKLEKSAEESDASDKEPLIRITTTEVPISTPDNDASSSENEEDKHLNELFNQDQCRLYYYRFLLSPEASSTPTTPTNTITHQWALSPIPLEFPSVHPALAMSAARYIYGCSTTSTSFGSALGKATKIDALVKVDARTLIQRGLDCPPSSVTGTVDKRSMAQVLMSNDPNDPVRVFCLPEGWYAQEPRFVPASRRGSSRTSGGVKTTKNGSEEEKGEVEEDDEDEDAGWLLFYAFDESQLSASGDVPPDDDEAKRAKSELWILDAKNMTEVVARVQLPQRVPYGLHGAWFAADEIAGQRPFEGVRTVERALQGGKREEMGAWMQVRDWVGRMLG